MQRQGYPSVHDPNAIPIKPTTKKKTAAKLAPITVRIIRPPIGNGSVALYFESYRHPRTRQVPKNIKMGKVFSKLYRVFNGSTPVTGSHNTGMAKTEWNVETVRWQPAGDGV